VEYCNRCGLRAKLPPLPPAPTKAPTVNEGSFGSALVSTLATIPGYRVVRFLGIVSQLSATSGLTAGMKGRCALKKATEELVNSAEEMGANAIVGR
jgi:hypothetical protein